MIMHLVHIAFWRGILSLTFLNFLNQHHGWSDPSLLVLIGCAPCSCFLSLLACHCSSGHHLVSVVNLIIFSYENLVHGTGKHLQIPKSTLLSLAITSDNYLYKLSSILEVRLFLVTEVVRKLFQTPDALNLEIMF